MILFQKRKKMTKEKKEIEKERCSNCGSTQIYLRLKTKDKYCRICGFVEDFNKRGDKD